MDDNAKNTCAHQVDQELLDARGINMTVEEVSGLPTSKYAARVQSLQLSDDDLVFLKALRRRIKNRLASQNSRRRSVEHLRRLTRELRAVRACRRDALAERRALVVRRDTVRDKCVTLRRHLVQILQERSDKTEVPSIDLDILPPRVTRKISVADTKIPPLPEQHISVIVKNIASEKLPVIVKNDIDREKLRRELEKEKDIYERVRQELQKEILVKETVTIPNFVKETLVIKEEMPDYEEITIDDDFESKRRNHKSPDGCFDERRSPRDIFVDRRNSATKRRYSANERRNSATERRNSALQSRNCEDIYESSDDLEMRHFNDIRSESSDRDIFECKIGKLVTQSVNHIYNDKKKVFAKTVFIANDKLSSDIKTMVLTEAGQTEVLNLSVKEGRRKSHGRKQSAPRRIAYYDDCDDVVLDLKVKKEPQ